MNFNDVIKDYLEKQIVTDASLRAVYKADQIEKCCSYIKTQAKKQAKNGCAAIDDATVYKWARDFYYDDLESEPEEDVVAEVEAMDIKTPEDVEKAGTKLHKAIKQKKPVVVEDNQPSLFDDLF